MGLRTQDPVPEWISHVAIVRDGIVVTGKKDAVLAEEEKRRISIEGTRSVSMAGIKRLVADESRPVVEMKNVNVAYHERKVNCTATLTFTKFNPVSRY